MFPRFGLVLMVNHACNLRCTYCYTGAKFDRAMPFATGAKAIDRALASLAGGGVLELGFFGGEPLIEAALVSRLVSYARGRTGESGCGLALGVTSNGAQTSRAAWSIMTDPDLDLAISHDGLPRVHDRHRVFADGRGSSKLVTETLTRLVEAGKDFRVVMVVRPTTVEALPDGIDFLQGLGVSRVDLSLDLWTRWSREDAVHLDRAIVLAAALWRDRLPHLAINWFDEKAARMAAVPGTESARCGFGRGEVAVAPSGHLYPCERLIGEDLDTNPMRLPGDACEGDDFLDVSLAASRSAPACSVCSIESICSTSCRCSNYVRTGRVDQPDGLLCLLDKLCFRETARAFQTLGASGVAEATMEVGNGRNEARA